LESLIYLKACLKMVIFSSYVRRSLPFVSRFTSILMLEGSQLRFGRRLHKLEKLVSDPYLLYLANKNMLKLKLAIKYLLLKFTIP
jgi:hypothetical protein